MTSLHAVQNRELSLGDRPGRCRQPRAAAGPEGAPAGEDASGAPSAAHRAAQGHGRPAAPRRPSPRPPPPRRPLGAGALGPLGEWPPYPELQTRRLPLNTNFPPVSPTRNSSAAPAPSHPAVCGLPIGSGERERRGERERAGRGGARDGPAPSPETPGAAGRRYHCMLGNGVFYWQSEIPVPLPPWASGKCGLQPRSPSFWSDAVPGNAVATEIIVAGVRSSFIY